MKRALFVALFAGALAGALLFMRTGPARPASGFEEFTAEEVEAILSHSPLGPPPPDPTNAVADQPGAARLGQMVFFDKRFSREGTVSCATCHDPAKGFGDGEALSTRFPLDRNVPTLWNTAYNRWWFWDGRADSAWSQALQPLENPREHGFRREHAVRLVRADARLRGAYEAVFGPMPEGPEADRPFANLGKAVAAYERKLLSRRSAFDVFAEGVRARDPAKAGALSAEARQGLKVFLRAQCRSCHGGPNFTDGEFHDLGIAPLRGGPAPSRHAGIALAKADPFNGKGAFSDRPGAGAAKLDFLAVRPESWGQVKTPTLRNVAKTGPYMHQGQFATLRAVVRFYSTMDGRIASAGHAEAILAPLRLAPTEAAALVAFLESLTDESADAGLLKPVE